jgi:hypothetical protein
VVVEVGTSQLAGSTCTHDPGGVEGGEGRLEEIDVIDFTAYDIWPARKPRRTCRFMTGEVANPVTKSLAPRDLRSGADRAVTRRTKDPWYPARPFHANLTSP